MVLFCKASIPFRGEVVIAWFQGLIRLKFHTTKVTNSVKLSRAGVPMRHKKREPKLPWFNCKNISVSGFSLR